MHWKKIRELHPHQWVLVEVIKALTKSNKRFIDELTVVNIFSDIHKALEIYKKLHNESPQREYYVVHTDNEKLTVHERFWVGIRAA